MQIKTSFTALFFLQFAFAQSFPPDCQGEIDVRFEWRDLSDQQQQDYISALTKLHDKGGYDFYPTIHVEATGEWHNNAQFFPAHRYLLYKLHQDLKAIDPNVIMPYWDWSLDSQSPDKSSIWDKFGAGSSDVDACLNQGPFAGWIGAVSKQCLTRGFDSVSPMGWGDKFTSSLALSQLLLSSHDFDAFHQAIEPGPHGQVHVLIGGNNGAMSYMHSPEDPIFFQHHGFIDKLWSDWQQLSTSNSASYGGKNTNGSQAETSDILRVFSEQVRVDEVMGVQSMCYTYANPGTKPTSRSAPQPSLAKIKRSFGPPPADPAFSTSGVGATTSTRTPIRTPPPVDPAFSTSGVGATTSTRTPTRTPPPGPPPVDPAFSTSGVGATTTKVGSTPTSKPQVFASSAGSSSTPQPSSASIKRSVERPTGPPPADPAFSTSGVGATTTNATPTHTKTKKHRKRRSSTSTAHPTATPRHLYNVYNTVSPSKRDLTSSQAPSAVSFNLPACPEPMPLDFIQRMKYDLASVQKSASQICSIYNDVFNKLQTGQILSGSGVMDTNLTALPASQDHLKSSFGNFSPYPSAVLPISQKGTVSQSEAEVINTYKAATVPLPATEATILKANDVNGTFPNRTASYDSGAEKTIRTDLMCAAIAIVAAALF